MQFDKRFQHLKIEGRTNTWYQIDVVYWKGQRVRVLENEFWGDEADWIFVDASTLEVPASKDGEDVYDYAGLLH